jgi:hypothetical protein
MYNTSHNFFLFKSKKFNYCINSHNTRQDQTERVVEIPLLKFALESMTNPIEIGCVSPYYWNITHKVYDLTDNHPLCENINAKNINLIDQNIISISTIEHFDIDNYNIDILERIDPEEFLNKIIMQSKKYFITIPLGYNENLTKTLLNMSNISFLVRNNGCDWRQKEKNELSKDNLTYNTSYWFANSVAIIENIFK